MVEVLMWSVPVAARQQSDASKDGECVRVKCKSLSQDVHDPRSLQRVTDVGFGVAGRCRGGVSRLFGLEAATKTARDSTDRQNLGNSQASLPQITAQTPGHMTSAVLLHHVHPPLVCNKFVCFYQAISVV